MISRLALSVGCLLWAGIAASHPGAERAAESSSAKLETIQIPPNVQKRAVVDVRVVDINTLDTGLQCERTKPTGSRIAIQQCYTREEIQARTLAQEATRHDMEEMRQQQIFMEQARADARRRAIADSLGRR